MAMGEAFVRLSLAFLLGLLTEASADDVTTSSDVNNTIYLGPGIPTGFLPDHPSSSWWPSVTLRNGFILLSVVLVVLLGILAFRYFRTKKSRIPRYTKLNTASNTLHEQEEDEVEMSIYEKKTGP